jgi:hypothetical protein
MSVSERPDSAPDYDAAPDVGWTYGFVVDGSEPDEALLSVMRGALALYAEQRAQQLGRPVRIVGAMGWDTPTLAELPRWVRRQVLETAPPAVRRPLGGLRRNVTLVRAWQHTDYRETRS